MSTDNKFETDPILVKLRRRLDAIEELIERRELEGVTNANFMEYSVNYMTLERLEARRVDLNRRYQQRRAELQGRDFALGQYVVEESDGIPTKV